MQEWFVPSLIEIGQMFHFKTFFAIYHTHVKIVSPLVAPPDPGDHNLYKRESALSQEVFV
jgi:hypothetical protein